MTRNLRLNERSLRYSCNCPSKKGLIYVRSNLTLTKHLDGERWALFWWNFIFSYGKTWKTQFKNIFIHKKVLKYKYQYSLTFIIHTFCLFRIRIKPIGRDFQKFNLSLVRKMVSFWKWKSRESLFTSVLSNSVSNFPNRSRSYYSFVTVL